jgi:hypothetical protein
VTASRVRELAYHEAGHVIVARSFGLPVKRCGVSDACGGETDCIRAGGDASVADAIVAAAGVIAQLAFAPGSEPLRGSSDMAFVQEIAERLHPGDVGKQSSWQDWVVTLAAEQLYARRPAIIAVAEALIERGELSGAQIDALLAGVD